MAMRVAVVDCGTGNLASAARALAAAAERAGIAAAVEITADPAAVAAADRLVLPGQGAFMDCAMGLAAVPGLWAALHRGVEAGRPFLGICVGMQLMAEMGEEMGEHRGLGWLAGRVRRLHPADPAAKVPHMGWNDVRPVGTHPLIPAGQAYFLHSYAFEGEGAPECLVAMTDHAGPVTAAVGRDNMLGVQFHPEKSQRYGLELLRSFLAWRP